MRGGQVLDLNMGPISRGLGPHFLTFHSCMACASKDSSTVHLTWNIGFYFLDADLQDL